MIKLIAFAAILFSSNINIHYKSADIGFVKGVIPVQNKSIYDFKVLSLNGDTIDFASFKGKKILIVNTASKCGFTPQYEGLEKLYEKYKDRLIVVGFPANNFLYQEQSSNEKI